MIVLSFPDNCPENCLKTGRKRPVFDTKLAIERATRLETGQDLLQMMRICCAVVLSYSDAIFESHCGKKDFWIACLLLLLLLKCVAHPWTLRRVVKP